MTKMFSFWFVENTRHSYPFLGSSSNLPSYVCPIALDSTLPLLLCSGEIVLLAHHLHCHSSLETCLDGYEENAL